MSATTGSSATSSRFEYPSGSGRQLPLDAIAADLQDRLISIFLVGPDGRRPCFGWVERLQNDPAWKDNLVFSEYFHGDNAAALGAAHQTGWTGVVADLIRRRYGEVPSVGDVVRTWWRGRPGHDRPPGRQDGTGAARKPVPARRDPR